MTSTRSKSRGNAAAGGTATLHMLQPSGIDSLGSVFPLPNGDLGVAGEASTTPLYRRSMPSSVGLGSPDRGSCPYLSNHNTRRTAAAFAAASVPSSRGLAGGYRRGSAGTTTTSGIPSNPGSWGAVAGAGPLGGSDSDVVGYPSPAGNLFGRRGMSVSNVGGGASDRAGAGGASPSPFDRYDSSSAASPSPYETDTTFVFNGWPGTGVSTRNSTTMGPGTCATVDTVGDREGNSHNFENSPDLNLEQQRETRTAMASSTSPPPLASDVTNGGTGDRTNESSIFARWFGSGSSTPADPPRGPPVEEEPGIAVSNVNEPGSPPVPSGVPVQGEFSSLESEPLASLAPAPTENTPAAAASAAPPPPAPPSPPVTRRTSPRRKRKREQLSPAAEENRDANVDEAKPRARRSRRNVRVKAENDIVVDVDKDDDEDPSASASGDGGTGVACCICLEVAAKTELAKVNGCEHGFCFACIEKWAERENTCPLCKERFTKIDRVNKPPSKRRKKGDAPSPRAKNTKRVKNRDQRADFTGSNALQGLLANMESGSLPHSIAQFIFSNVTGGLMTLNSGGPQGSNRLPEGGISGRVVARAFPLPMGSNGPYSARSSSRGIPTRAFRVELNAAPSDRGSGGGAADDPFDPIVVQPGSTTFLSASSPTSSTLRRSLQRSIPPQQDTSWEQHLAASGGSSSDLDFDDDDDDEVDDLGSGGENYGSFIQRVRDLSNHRNSVLQRYQVGIGGVGGGGGNGVGGLPRSYAVNSQDLTAGESAENALEIEDSDEDDDLDVIEVVDVGAN